MDAATLHALTPIGRLGRYELLGRIAAGGMGEIFLARESGPAEVRRELVVKRILPHVARADKIREMFAQEARLCMRLRHPNICPIYEFGEQDGTFYLAMEWVRGESLDDLIELARDRGGLPVPFVVSIASGIAGALHHAHTAKDELRNPLGIVHRDVTPENILVGYDGITKLIDFGVAKAVTQRHKTQAGETKGKFEYISPEQYKGHALDGRSDVFSLGVCLYEALSGESLYERASEYETVAAIVLDPSVPSIREVRPDMPEDLDAILQKALAKNRDHRYESADALQRALQGWLTRHGHSVRETDVAALLEELCPDGPHRMPALDRSAVVPGESAAAPAEPQIEPTERFALEADLDDEAAGYASRARRKRRLVLVVAAVVVLGILGVSAFALRSSPEPREPEPDRTARPP